MFFRKRETVFIFVFLFLIVIFLQFGFCPSLRSGWKPFGATTGHKATDEASVHYSLAEGTWDLKQTLSHTVVLSPPPLPHPGVCWVTPPPCMGAGWGRLLLKITVTLAKNASSKRPGGGLCLTELVLSRIKGSGHDQRICYPQSLQILRRRGLQSRKWWVLTVPYIWGDPLLFQAGVSGYHLPCSPTCSQRGGFFTLPSFSSLLFVSCCWSLVTTRWRMLGNCSNSTWPYFPHQ